MSALEKVVIEKLAFGGQGIARIEGKVCFVDGVIPGEVVRVRIVKNKRDYSVGAVTKILENSPHRITARCPVYLQCGGCQLQHVEYVHQVELKKQVVVDTCKRIGGFEPTIEEAFSGQIWNYRNKAQLPVENHRGIRVGYYRTGSHEVVEHESCPINADAINRALPVLKRRLAASKVSIYEEKSHGGSLRHLMIRAGTTTDQLHVTFVTKEVDLPTDLYSGLGTEIDGIVGISHNINPERTNRTMGRDTATLWGVEFIEERILDRVFRFGPSSFFQVNTQIAEAMVKTAVELLAPDGREVLFDLYAGVGTFGVSIADRVSKVIAIEESGEAASYGIGNAERCGVKNVQFVKGRVEERLESVGPADAAIVDPPRKGLETIVIDQLGAKGPKKILDVSCNPSTFARDVKHFGAHGYRPGRCLIFDMFPQTYHIESMCLLEK